jgi:hypothetical protein
VTGRLVAVWRYPVKSMLGEELSETEVTDLGWGSFCAEYRRLQMFSLGRRITMQEVMPMATPEEIRRELESMQPDELEKVKHEFICPTMSINDLAMLPINRPELEAKLCHILGLPTEVDRVAAATFEAARYQKWSFYLSAVAIIIAVASLVVAIIAIAKQ